MKEESQDFVYPIQLTKMKYCTKSQNMMNIGDNKLLMGKLSHKMIVGVVRLDAFHGHFSHNPFYYQHCNAQNVQAMLNGALVPIHSFDVDFSDSDKKNCLFIMALHSLLEATNSLYNPNFNIGINCENYAKSGNALYGFVTALSGPLETEGESFEDMGTGSVDIKIKLREPIGYPTILIVLAEFDGEICISPDVVVRTEFLQGKKNQRRHSIVKRVNGQHHNLKPPVELLGDQEKIWGEFTPQTLYLLTNCQK